MFVFVSKCRVYEVKGKHHHNKQLYVKYMVHKQGKNDNGLQDSKFLAMWGSAGPIFLQIFTYWAMDKKISEKCSVSIRHGVWLTDKRGDSQWNKNTNLVEREKKNTKKIVCYAGSMYCIGMGTSWYWKKGKMTTRPQLQRTTCLKNWEVTEPDVWSSFKML